MRSEKGKSRVVSIIGFLEIMLLIGELDFEFILFSQRIFISFPRTAISEYILKRKSRKTHYLPSPLFLEVHSTGKGKQGAHGTDRRNFSGVIFADFKVLLFPGG